MQFQQFVNDWWPVIIAVCPLAFLFVGSHIVRTITLVLALAYLISILRKQNEQNKNVEPKAQPQGSAA